MVSFLIASEARLMILEVSLWKGNAHHHTRQDFSVLAAVPTMHSDRSQPLARIAL